MSPTPPEHEPMPRTFEYLLNALEAAAHDDAPADVGYAEKRKAVLQYVSDLYGDARRFRVLLKDPVGARHLLHLLQQGKGDEAAFRSMIDRIDQSREASGVR